MGFNSGFKGLMLFTHLRRDSPNGQFASACATIMYAFLIFTLRATCPTYRAVLYSITLALLIFLDSRETFFFSGITCLSTLLSDARRLCPLVVLYERLMRRA